MVRLLVVGQSGIELDGKRLTTESEIVFGMLLYLSARAGEMVSRDEAQALFWPDHSHTRGRHCLRQALYRLRQLGVPLRSDNGSFGVALGDVTTDYAALAARDVPATAFRDLLIGDILPGYQPAFATPFARWVEEFRSRIGMRVRQGLVRTILELRSKGRYREAEPLARTCLTGDPFNELATLTLAESAAVLRGNKAEAMAILDRYIAEIGGTLDKRVALSASILRRRISERFVEQRYAALPEPPLVGREDVLQLMVEKMQEAVAGRSSVVYLWGEPGIGKSRLLDELMKIGYVQGVRLERFVVAPNDEDKPLALFSTMLPRLMQISGAAGISTDAFEAIHRFIDPTAWNRVEPPRSAAEAASVFGQLKAAICDLFQALGDERCLGILIDDVHWLDPRSSEVLAEVIESVRGRSVAVVMTSRAPLGADCSKQLAALHERADARQLASLGAREVEWLLTLIAEQRNFALTSEFVRRTVDASAGNPLFVSELATHYMWNGVRDDLPHSMHSLLEKRLTSLNPESLLAFQVCAVLGENGSLERIQKVLQWPTHKILRVLQVLQVSSMLKSPAEGRLICRHELLRKEALSRLSPVTLQALYQKAAVVLARAAINELNPSLCWHAVQAWLDGHESNRAVQLVRTMAIRLLGSGLAVEADDFLSRARQLLADNVTAVDLLSLHWRAARAHGDLRRSRDLAVECQQLSKTLHLRPSEAALAEFMAFDASRALEISHTGLQFGLTRLEESRESADVLGELATRLVMTADDLVDPTIARRCYSLVSARGLLHRMSRDVRRLFELVYHSHYGRLSIALARARHIVAKRDGARSGDPNLESRQLRWAHRPFQIAGLFDDALYALDRSCAAARRCGSDFDDYAGLCYTADVLIAADRLDDAERALNVVERTSRESAAIFIDGVSAIRALVMFARGEPAEMDSAVNRVRWYTLPGMPRRGHLIVDTLRILHALLVGMRPDSDRVARLLSLWPEFRWIGGADAGFLAIMGALIGQQSHRAAAELCREYAACRRERYGLPAYMTQRLQQWLGCTATELRCEFNLDAERAISSLSLARSLAINQSGAPRY